MKTNLTNILDYCIEQVIKGETIESSLAKYPDMRAQLEPLLRTALSISSTPKVRPSLEYLEISRLHLMRVIRQEAIQASTGKKGKRFSLPGGLIEAFQDLRRSFISARRAAIPITIALVLVIIAGLSQFIFLKPTSAGASTCTLSIFSGNVSIQNPGNNDEYKGLDGMTLSVGTKIKTAPNSYALLTFFEGSTVKLDPDTYLEIIQIEYGDNQQTTILLKQWLGRTWSRVIKLVDSGSRYEIETPSATAMVRGTLFTTEVAATGATKVSTTQGLVSVAAQDQEVYVPVNQQTEVNNGMKPSQPVLLTGPKSEIVVTINGTAAGSISDPTGASTGILPSGRAFNQIQGSYSSAPSEGTQIISVAEPVSGKYIITLRSLAKGSTSFRIQGKSNGMDSLDYGGTLYLTKDGGYLIHLDLEVEDGAITGGAISKMELLGDNIPEKIVDKSVIKGTPPGQSNAGGAGVTPAGQGNDGGAGNTPVGKGNDDGVVKTPPGQGNDGGAGKTPLGQGNVTGATPPGQGNVGGVNLPGKGDDDGAERTPPKQGNVTGVSPPGQGNVGGVNLPGKGDDDGAEKTPPGQGNVTGVTPPGQGNVDGVNLPGKGNVTGQKDTPPGKGDDDGAGKTPPGQKHEQEQDQGKDQGQKQEQDQDQGKDQGQQQEQDQGKDQGQQQEQDQGKDQGQQQEQDQDQGKDQGQKQEQDQGQGQGQGQGKDQGQKQEQDQEQGKDQGQKQEQDQEQGKDQGQKQEQGQGKDQGQKQEQDQGKDQGQKQEQGQGKDQGQKQEQEQEQEQDQGKDQGQKQKQEQDQGKDQGKDQGQGQGKAKEKERGNVTGQKDTPPGQGNAGDKRNNKSE